MRSDFLCKLLNLFADAEDGSTDEEAMKCIASVQGYLDSAMQAGMVMSSSHHKGDSSSGGHKSEKMSCKCSSVNGSSTG